MGRPCHFNPLTPRGVRPGSQGVDKRSCDFNPLTPRGVRPGIGAFNSAGTDFNPLTPRGVRPSQPGRIGSAIRFQSTHPSRGETLGFVIAALFRLDFNPLTPRGVRQS